ncbi:hypothetical protein BGZ96_004558 [Linnemannia gamsii]|uniref:Uncharacterized protein n=1 Tax=Linnemannia gamsii TaxID=64522 RepID=A0ABQ7JI21_9FUNG|nr:hypothetical protein BGZ96_004558 [Linnemannia gamsii]
MGLADAKGIPVVGGIGVMSPDLVEDVDRPIPKGYKFTAVWRFHLNTTGQLVKDSDKLIPDCISTGPVEHTLPSEEKLREVTAMGSKALVARAKGNH